MERAQKPRDIEGGCAQSRALRRDDCNTRSYRPRWHSSANQVGETTGKRVRSAPNFTLEVRSKCNPEINTVLSIGPKVGAIPVTIVRGVAAKETVACGVPRLGSDRMMRPEAGENV